MTLLQPPSDAFNKWLATLPTTAFVTVCGVVLAFFSAGIILPTIAMGRHMEAGVIAAWLSFVAAILGVGHISYKVKRETWRPDVVADDDATGDAPYHVVAQTPDYLSKLPAPVQRAASAIEQRIAAQQPGGGTPYIPHLSE